MDRVLASSGCSRVGWISAALAAVLLVGMPGCSGGGGGGGGGSSAPLAYEGPARWDVSGPQGGPFSNTTFFVVVENTSPDPVAWSVASMPTFVDLFPSSGIVQPGTRTTIQADLDAAAAATLGPGNYTQSLKLGSGGEVAIDCTLSVWSPGLSAQLTPPTDFNSQGAANGPFLPDRAIYTLTNTGNSLLDWRAGATDPWITVSPPNGVLTASQSVAVTVSIDDASTAALPLGLHPSVVEWRDTATGAILHTRLVSLNVLTDSSASGWTAFTPSADTRVIYVSASQGDDGNDGLSDATPKFSIAAGKALLRDGFPDWLLLRRGDAWDEGFGQWDISGRSLTEPILLSSYGPGTQRPLLRTGSDSGLEALTGSRCDHTAVVGLHFWANGYTGSEGVPRALQISGSIQDFLIEDCYLQAYETNLVIEGASEFPSPTGRHKNMVVRRNVIVDAYNTGVSNSQGIYAAGTDGLLIVENVFDHNGWRDDVPGSEPTWFRRNIYIQNGNTDVVVRGNILANTDGMQVRPGGTVEDNLLLHTAIAILVGGGENPEAAGVTGLVRRNVILDGNDLQPGSERGWGMNFENVRQATVQANLIAHNVSGHDPFPLIFGVAANGAGVRDIGFSNNVVYGWNGYTRFTGGVTQVLDIHLSNNRIQNEVSNDPLILHEDVASTVGVLSSNNSFYSIANANEWMSAGGPLSLPAWKQLVHDTSSVAQQVVFPDPGRSIATYHASIGGGASLGAFMDEARKQSRATWRPQYTAEAVGDYIRAGFGL